MRELIIVSTLIFFSACGSSDNSLHESCGGLLGAPCDQGQYCKFEIGTCGAADQPGTCEDIPQACLQIYQPVCGCDDKNYGNDCEAAVAQTSINKIGTCENNAG